MNHSEIDFRYTMTFSQCVHGVYDEKMEAVYRKYSQNYSFKEDSESTFVVKRREVCKMKKNTGVIRRLRS